MFLRRAFLSTMTVVLMCYSAFSQQNLPRFTIGLSAGYAIFTPADLNSLLSRLSFPEIKGGLKLSGDVGYFITRSLSIHLAGGYVIASSKSTIPVTTSTGPGVVATAGERYRITALPIGLGVVYHLPIEPINLNIGAFADLNFATAEYRLDETPVSSSQTENRKKSPLGGHFYVGPEFGLTEGFGLQLQLGYRLAKISGLDGSQGFFPVKLDVDFTGVYAVAGVRFRF